MKHVSLTFGILFSVCCLFLSGTIDAIECRIGDH